MGDRDGRKIPYVNLAIIAVNIIYFLYLEVAGSSEDADFMITQGALFAPLIVEHKEYYRLVTAVFMHFGIEHIANNMLILFILGGNLERAMGKVKYLIFYLLCGIGANAVTLMMNKADNAYTVSAGASGAIFGVVGGLLYAVVINKGRLEDFSTRQLTVVIACSLYFGFVSTGVNNTAHVAGLVIGNILGVLLYRKPKKPVEYEMRV